METSTRISSAQFPSTTEDIAKMRNVPYHEAVSSLMYASLGMCPDITYAVQAVLRFLKNPGDTTSVQPGLNICVLNNST